MVVAVGSGSDLRWVEAAAGFGSADEEMVIRVYGRDLQWERTTGINVGVDFTLLNNRLSGTLEYYDNNTTDLLYPVRIPNITGFDTILTNLGKIHNKGFEAGLTYQFVNQKDFSCFEE